MIERQSLRLANLQVKQFGETIEKLSYTFGQYFVSLKQLSEHVATTGPLERATLLVHVELMLHVANV